MMAKANERVRTRWRRAAGISSGLALSVMATSLACSDDGDTDAAVAGNRPATEAPPGAAGTSGAAAAPAPPPTSSETPAEGNPMPAGPVEGNPPAPGMPQAPGTAGTASGASAADAGVAPSPPTAPACARDLTDANKAAVEAAIDELFVQGDITAADRYWGEPYLQHNPIAASGVAAFRNLFGGLVSPGNSIYDLSRTLGECDLVVIHGNYTSFGGPTFDMFRVAEGRIIEHWDAFAASAGPNPSGHTALDGPTAVEDVELGPQNEALVLGFVDDVLIGGAVDTIASYMSPDLVEHDPDSQDGSAAFVQNLQTRAITYRQVHHDIADGNFVFVISEGAVGPTGVAHYDLYRVDSSLIVEHWNGRRDIPTTPTASGLGIF
jgi:predicted SnoaL-like aldol condensation-catalyzing enzyme